MTQNDKSAQERLAERQLEAIERRESLERKWAQDRAKAERSQNEQDSRCPGGDPDWCG